MLIDGVVNEAPVPKTAPPLNAEYHLSAFAFPPNVAPNVTVPAAHLAAGVVDVTNGLLTTTLVDEVKQVAPAPSLTNN